MNIKNNSFTPNITNQKHNVYRKHDLLIRLQITFPSHPFLAGIEGEVPLLSLSLSSNVWVFFNIWFVLYNKLQLADVKKLGWWKGEKNLRRDGVGMCHGEQACHMSSTLSKWGECVTTHKKYMLFFFYSIMLMRYRG